MSVPGFTAGRTLERRAGGGGLSTSGGSLEVPPGCLCTSLVWVCEVRELCWAGWCVIVPVCWPECGSYICW
jgi:hypothetical protein